MKNTSKFLEAILFSSALAVASALTVTSAATAESNGGSPGEDLDITGGTPNDTDIIMLQIVEEEIAFDNWDSTTEQNEDNDNTHMKYDNGYERYDDDGDDDDEYIDAKERSYNNNNEDYENVDEHNGDNARSSCQCGKANLGNRIIGGEEVDPRRKYPWVVGLKKRGSNIMSCGGSIINSRWILTAAHCFVDTDTCKIITSVIKVLVGEHNYKTTDDDHHSDTKQYSIKTCLPHPYYTDYYCGRTNSYDFNRYDFGLIELTKPISFDNNIRPICLPESDGNNYFGRIAIVSGWGRTSNSKGSGSDILREADVKILANHDCNSRGQVSPDKMCATWETGVHCSGDSGGPLVVDENRNGIYVLVGVVSYSRGQSNNKECDSYEYPTVYGRVSEVRQWITDKTKSGTSCN